MAKIIFCISLSVVGFLIHACGSEEVTKQITFSEEHQSTSSLYVGKSLAWKEGVVPVCWDQNNIPSIETWDAIKAHIVKLYEDKRIHFSDWSVCPVDRSTSPFAKGIKIVSKDMRSHTSGFGTQNALKEMVINFEFRLHDNGGPCPSNPLGCSLSIAAHEFGHALGARHEQNRPDTPPDCTNWLKLDASNDASIERGTMWSVAPYQSPWDIHSIMNYCNSSTFNYNGIDYGTQYQLRGNNGGWLSELDDKGFQELYGKSKITYSYATAMHSAPTWNFALEPNQAGSHILPELLMVYNLDTGAGGTVEVHGLSGPGDYKYWTKHIATPIPIQKDRNTFFGHDFFDYNNDKKMDLVYFVNNGASKKLEVHIYDGASNFQIPVLHANTPLVNSNLYRFAFGGDYNYDGQRDIWVIYPTASGTAQLVVLDGANHYTKILLSREIPLTNDDISKCKFVLGNFYGEFLPTSDLACLWTPLTTSASTKLFLFSQLANYHERHDGEISFLHGEDGTNMDFDLWNFPSTLDQPLSATKIPGQGIRLAFIKKNSAPVEIHYIEAVLYY